MNPVISRSNYENQDHLCYMCISNLSPVRHHTIGSMDLMPARQVHLVITGSYIGNTTVMRHCPMTSQSPSHWTFFSPERQEAKELAKGETCIVMCSIRGMVRLVEKRGSKEICPRLALKPSK
ncbi:UNVERIFIED_CONTAM: hypothetical protein K2H54_057984 [Gekko kuhli]